MVTIKSLYVSVFYVENDLKGDLLIVVALCETICLGDLIWIKYIVLGFTLAFPVNLALLQLPQS